MVHEKVTVMVLKFDLRCPSCCRKIKKLLRKFPQIRDQVYDEKQNTVTITVICCSPENIRDKLWCRGGKTIKSIEIKEPPKPKEPDKPKVPEKPKEPEKPKLPALAPAPAPALAPKAPEPAPNPHPPVHGYPSVYPVGFYYSPCYEGYPGGPCYDGYGRPPSPPPQPSYDACRYGYGPYGYGGRGCYVSRCDDYFNEENATGCSIM